jgi:hypothetical protein
VDGTADRDGRENPQVPETGLPDAQHAPIDVCENDAALVGETAFDQYGLVESLRDGTTR